MNTTGATDGVAAVSTGSSFAVGFVVPIPRRPPASILARSLKLVPKISGCD